MTLQRPLQLPIISSLALSLVLLSAGCGQQKTAGAGGGKASSEGRVQPVEVAQIQRRDLVETLNLVGSLAANETAQIRAEIAGQIREVLFDEGQFVKKGQLLMRVDDAELRAQLAQSKARLALTEQNLKRVQSLVAQQLISEADADQARSDYDAATAEAEYLSVRVAKMEIKAPFDGVAGARTVSPGDYVTASVTATAITTIDDLSRLKIEFQVPERYSLRVKPGTKFRVRARTTEGEEQATGEVYFASMIIDRTTRSTQVKGYIDQMIEGLRPGMFVNIELELSTHKNVLVVPEGSILVTASTGPQIVVVRERDGKYFADFVPVEIGLRIRGLVEINIIKVANKDPVDESSRVVASGVGALILYQDGRLDPRPLRKEFTLGGDEL